MKDETAERGQASTGLAFRLAVGNRTERTMHVRYVLLITPARTPS